MWVTNQPVIVIAITIRIIIPPGYRQSLVLHNHPLTTSFC